MNVSDLIQLLEKFDGEKEVVFVTQENHPMVGFFAAIGDYQEMDSEYNGDKDWLEQNITYLEDEISKLEDIGSDDLQSEIKNLYFQLEEAEEDLGDWMTEHDADNPKEQIIIAIHENQDYADGVQGLTWEHGQRQN